MLLNAAIHRHSRQGITLAAISSALQVVLYSARSTVAVVMCFRGGNVLYRCFITIFHTRMCLGSSLHTIMRVHSGGRTCVCNACNYKCGACNGL